MNRKLFLLLSSLATLLLAIFSGFLFKAIRPSANIDHQQRFEILAPLNLLLTTSENLSGLYQASSRGKYQLKSVRKDSANTNFCVPNLPATPDPKQQLQSFIEGPCSPVIIVPGITATKLQVTIDCETLQSQAPDIFASCGWGTCSSSWFYTQPDTEYSLWVASLDSPMEFIIPTFTTQECFGNLVNLGYDPNQKEIYLKYINPPGVNVTWYGNTPKTAPYSNCGFGGIENILPLPFQTSETSGYVNMQDYYQYMGYQVGLTLFAVPYDFRKTTLANDLYYTLKRTIRYVHALTGKKVILMAHSMGNFGALNILNSMTPEEKDQMILTYVAVSPPYLGTAKALKVVIGGDDEFVWHGMGLSFYSQKMFLGSSAAVYDLLSKDVFFKYEDTEWLKEIMERVQLERNHSINTEEGQAFWEASVQAKNYSFLWFPTPLDSCFYHFLDRNACCGVMVADRRSNYLLKIDDGQNATQYYYANIPNISQILTTITTFTNNTLKLLDDAYTNKVSDLINPEVPVILIYGSHTPTEFMVDYDYNPTLVTDSGSFAWPSDEVPTNGDTTVSSTASLIAGLKWAWEFDHKDSNKSLKNAKPVKVVEWCSFFNTNVSWYDTNYTNQTNLFLENGYLGLNCTCQPTEPTQYTDGTGCVHANIMNDQYFIDMMMELSKSYEFLQNSSHSLSYNITAKNLTALVNVCPHLTYNRSVQDVQSLVYGYVD